MEQGDFLTRVAASATSERNGTERIGLPFRYETEKGGDANVAGHIPHASGDTCLFKLTQDLTTRLVIDRFQIQSGEFVPRASAQTPQRDRVALHQFTNAVADCLHDARRLGCNLGRPLTI